ncbi:MAG TPA: phage tail protein [Candidatus Eisenbacteria bacterium]|nr:phage tail protein [Candidatus Eisenbacteria bacterium]
MGFLFALALYVGFTLLGRLIRPDLPATKRNRRDQLAIPTAAPGGAIPIVWGSVYLNDPNVIWWGMVRVYRTVGNGLVTNVFTDVDIYMVSVTLVLCHGPCDTGVSLYWDDTLVVPNEIIYNPVTERTRIMKHRYGDMIAREHLVAGQDYTFFDDYYYYYRGTMVQEPVSTEATYAGMPTPAYRGVAYLFLDRVLLGASIQGAPPMKRLAAQVVRRPNQLGMPSGHEQINNDSNPACMLYEVLTDSRWGMGLPVAAIDVDSFRAAGETLFTEGTGMSLVVKEQQAGRDVIDEILRHIDGVVFTDPSTGLFTLSLARGDYVFANLPVFDESNVTNVEISRPSWSETKNHVRVRYTGPKASERVASETNLANVQKRGVLVPIDVSYPGFTNATTAQRAASRDLKTFSFPFARIRITVNRKAWSLRPNSVFRLTWPKLGVADMVCRVVRVDPGTLIDGKIVVDAIEDAFATNWVGVPVALPNWQDPVQDPLAMAIQRLEEAPYALAGGAHRQILTLGARPEGLTQGYDVWSDPAGGEAYAQTNTRIIHTPLGILDGVLGFTDTSFSVVSGLDLESLFSITAAQLASGYNLCLIDDELIAWKTITQAGGGTATVSEIVRGVADTTPRQHQAGARVWFLTSGKGTTRTTDYGSDVTVTAKLPTLNVNKRLDLADTYQLKVTTANRAGRPYVPTAVELNGDPYPNVLTGEQTISWSHRNRLGSWEYDDAGATGSPESGTTYRAKFYGDGGGYGFQYGTVYGGYGKLKHTESGITGTSYLYPEATEKAENGGVFNTYRRWTLEALVGGLGSRQLYDYVVGGNGGYGYNYGNDYGG